MSFLINNHLKTGYSDYLLLFIKRYYKELELSNMVLDVGCGHYRNLYLLYQLGFRNLYGIDKRNPKPIEKPKRFKVNFVKEDIMNGLPYIDKQFDIVLCNYVLMFIDEEKLSYALNELLRVTKKYCVIETQKQFHEAKNTQIKHYDFKDIVKNIDGNEEFEILDRKIYKEKLILKRKGAC